MLPVASDLAGRTLDGEVAGTERTADRTSSCWLQWSGDGVGVSVCALSPGPRASARRRRRSAVRSRTPPRRSPGSWYRYADVLRAARRASAAPSGRSRRRRPGPSELTGSSACGVSITPGATALAVIPSGPYSTARFWTRPTSPALAAAYWGCSGHAETVPATDDGRDQPPIAGLAHRAAAPIGRQRQTPVRSTSSVAYQASSSSCSSGTVRAIPAFATGDVDAGPTPTGIAR